MEEDKENENKVEVKDYKRRSSILKPPRTRSPVTEILEEAPADPNSNKTTRRVSFAATNYVKPFVHDPETATIWDTTYEEVVNHTNSTQSSQERTKSALLESVATSLNVPPDCNPDNIPRLSIVDLAKNAQKASQSVVMDESTMEITCQISRAVLIKNASKMDLTKWDDSLQLTCQIPQSTIVSNQSSNLLDKSIPASSKLHEVMQFSCRKQQILRDLDESMQFTGPMDPMSVQYDVETDENQQSVKELPKNCQDPEGNLSKKLLLTRNEFEMTKEEARMKSICQKAGFIVYEDEKLSNSTLPLMANDIEQAESSNVCCQSLELSCQGPHLKEDVNSKLSKLGERKNLDCPDPLSSFRRDQSQNLTIPQILTKNDEEMSKKDLSKLDDSMTCQDPLPTNIIRQIFTMRDNEMTKLDESMEISCQGDESKKLEETLPTNENVSKISCRDKKHLTTNKNETLKSVEVSKLEQSTTLSCQKRTNQNRLPHCESKLLKLDLNCQDADEGDVSKQLSNVMHLTRGAEDVSLKFLGQNPSLTFRNEEKTLSKLNETCQDPQKQPADKLSSRSVDENAVSKMDESIHVTCQDPPLFIVKADDSKLPNNNCVSFRCEDPELKNELSNSQMSRTYLKMDVQSSNRIIVHTANNSQMSNTYVKSEQETDKENVIPVTNQSWQLSNPVVTADKENVLPTEQTADGSTSFVYPFLSTINEDSEPSAQAATCQPKIAPNLTLKTPESSFYRNLSGLSSGVDDTQHLLEMAAWDRSKSLMEPQLHSRYERSNTELMMLEADCSLGMLPKYNETVPMHEASEMMDIEPRRLLKVNDTLCLKSKVLRHKTSFVEDDLVLLPDDVPDDEFLFSVRNSPPTVEDSFVEESNYDLNIKRLSDFGDLIETFQRERKQIVQFLESFQVREIKIPKKFPPPRPSLPTSDESSEEVAVVESSVEEKIRQRAESCRKSWILESVDGGCYQFSTLFGKIKLAVELEPNSDKVVTLRTTKAMKSSAEPLQVFCAKFLCDKLSNEHIEAAIGHDFDILSLLDYVQMHMIRIYEFYLDFMLQQFLSLDEDFRIVYKVYSTPLTLHFIVRVPISDVENAGWSPVLQVDNVIGEANEADLRKIAQNCPRNLDFAVSFCRNVAEYVAVKENLKR